MGARLTGGLARILRTSAWLLAVALAAPGYAAELPTYAITLDSGRIEPSRLELPANTKVKFTLRNTGRGAVEFEGRDVRVEKVLHRAPNRSWCCPRSSRARIGSSTSSTRTRKTCW